MPAVGVEDEAGVAGDGARDRLDALGLEDAVAVTPEGYEMFGATGRGRNRGGSGA